MLPGKLCIGILEEDNPQKSYFRMKPLLIENDGRYEFFDSTELYPEEGCIRIVPDKNESSRFKARMRCMGRYCVLDLREHIGSNDKIRPNKNYRADETERNANIVYSDVVREPAEKMIFEILEDAKPAVMPGSACVLLGDSPKLWRCMPAEDGEGAHLEPDEGEIAEDDIQRFEIPGFSGEILHFAIRLPGKMTSVTDNPAPAATESASAADKPAADEEKPWISHDLPQTPAPDSRMSPMQINLASQSGLNPRRNRSLQEVIEEKWRHSRVDQLGHPVPANATGKPVLSPVETVVSAIRDAWKNPEIHDQLIQAISGINEVSAALEQMRQTVNDSAIRRNLEDLEAERLTTLGEIDRLNREKANLREVFKAEIRAEEAESLREILNKTEQAKSECEAYVKRAEEARRAAEFAQDALESLNDGRFEEKLRDFALTSHAAKYLTRPSAALEGVLPSDESPTREQWIERTIRAFAMEGLAISDVEAANLLICAALTDSMLLTGPASADKAGYTRALARVTGACNAGRFAEMYSSTSADRPKWIEDPSEIAGVIWIQNGNQVPMLNSAVLSASSKNLLTVSAVANGSFPIPAEAFERAFTLCVEPVRSDSAWNACAAPETEFPPVRLQALRSAFLDQPAEIPPALERRLQRVRNALAKYDVCLSRQTLSRMWKYCGAMIALGKISAGEALDRAFAQKALPAILAEAPIECLRQLGGILADFPRCLELLQKPLPIQI